MGAARSGVGRPLRRLVGSCVVLLVATVAGCGSDPATTSTTEAPPTASERSTTSSPFTVGAPPEGWTLVVAGTGDGFQFWGDDLGGTDIPSTFLRREGGTTRDDVVEISSVSTRDLGGDWWDPSQPLEDPGLEPLEVGGRPAYLQAGHPATLSVVWGEDLVLRVRAEAAADELVALALVSRPPTDHTLAPVVEVPAGYDLVGGFAFDAIRAQHPLVSATGERIPGGPRSHGAGWMQDPAIEGQHLAVVTVPADALDLDAFEARVTGPDESEATVERAELDGRPALEVTWTDRSEAGDEVVRGRTLLAETAWGDVLSVYAEGRSDPSTEPRSFAELRAVAASVTPADDEAWAAVRREAAGPPGLHPDPGRREIARGTVGDDGWLLQTGAAGTVPIQLEDAADAAGVELPDGSVAPDECLKLASGERSCLPGVLGSQLFHRIGGRTVVVAVSLTEVDGFPFLAADGVAETTVDAIAVPGGAAWVAVVEVDVRRPGCDPTADVDAPLFCLAGG